ncbi:MAG: hypothetical protein U1E55_03070 [Paracoccus sp. (in: a-proteobacteria)]
MAERPCPGAVHRAVLCRLHGIFGARSDTFLSTGNLLNILRQAAPVALIVAIAMTFVIVTAGIDLSVGSIVALVNMAAILMAQNIGWFTTIILMLVVGGLIGLVQELVHRAFLAYSGLYRHAGRDVDPARLPLWITAGYSIPITDQPGFSGWDAAICLGIPVPALIAILTAVAGLVCIQHALWPRRWRRRRLES